MENATRALVMAASVLIGILIITLMVFLFKSGAGVGKAGEKERARIETEEFNVHFSQYIGKELTIYDVVSINNLVESCKNKYGLEVKIEGDGKGKTKANIKDNIDNTYSLTVNDYKNGYISKITIN